MSSPCRLWSCASSPGWPVIGASRGVVDHAAGSQIAALTVDERHDAGAPARHWRAQRPPPKPVRGCRLAHGRRRRRRAPTTWGGCVVLRGGRVAQRRSPDEFVATAITNRSGCAWAWAWRRGCRRRGVGVAGGVGRPAEGSGGGRRGVGRRRERGAAAWCRREEGGRGGLRGVGGHTTAAEATVRFSTVAGVQPYQRIPASRKSTEAQPVLCVAVGATSRPYLSDGRGTAD